ncbi:MAG: response regulator [Candidatus Abyssobacteria bacterium SURF_17]|uniref:Response regulator n=1 Tax=Candidatus Abyssobacteria bacterium SURF_17 TaxID=2093361 RepID=A0A419EV56_9BACT|nr:MAG: response regulator [Candidatus Abyssubacteria bacterium SURF_17]
MSAAKKVLVVDDERNALVALAKILREDGYDVVVAATEEQAMHRLNRWRFDFIITDLFLLRSCCINLLNKIKSLKPLTPVILTTAHGDVNRYLDESSLEGMLWLSKPIKYDELRRVIGIIEAQSKGVSENETDFSEV